MGGRWDHGHYFRGDRAAFAAIFAPSGPNPRARTPASNRRAVTAATVGPWVRRTFPLAGRRPWRRPAPRTWRRPPWRGCSTWCRTFGLICGFAESLHGSAVLVDHPAEYLPAMRRDAQPHDDMLVIIGGRWFRDWCVRNLPTERGQGSACTGLGPAGPLWVDRRRTPDHDHQRAVKTQVRRRTRRSASAAGSSIVTAHRAACSSPSKLRCGRHGCHLDEQWSGRGSLVDPEDEHVPTGMLHRRWGPRSSSSSWLPLRPTSRRSTATWSARRRALPIGTSSALEHAERERAAADEPVVHADVQAGLEAAASDAKAADGADADFEI
jgi:hypothetical protein